MLGLGLPPLLYASDVRDDESSLARRWREVKAIPKSLLRKREVVTLRFIRSLDSKGQLKRRATTKGKGKDTDPGTKKNGKDDKDGKKDGKKDSKKHKSRKGKKKSKTATSTSTTTEATPTS